MCLQSTFSHACDISAVQGFAPYQGLGLRSVTMPTPPVPSSTHHSATCLKTALLYVAGPPTLKKLPDNLSSTQLHPHTPASQLYSESQRVQLQGLWAHSCTQKTHCTISAFRFSSYNFYMLWFKVPEFDGKNVSSVMGFESNQLPANAPIEDRRSAATCLQTRGMLLGVFDGHAGCACAQVKLLSCPATYLCIYNRN